MQSKIFFLNQQCVGQHREHARIREILDDHPYRWDHFFATMGTLEHIQSRYTRTSHNPWPFKNTPMDQSRYHIPELGTRQISFDYATEQRVEDLWVQAQGRPWAIFWSGGIDSTLVVAAVLKNLTQQQRKGFAICYNLFSVWENPRFFQDHIRPNFDLLYFDHVPDDFSADRFWIDGEPADCLWGTAQRYFQSDIIDDPWRGKIPHMIERLQLRCSDAAAVSWWVDQVIESVNHVQLPINTVTQFLWWQNYNSNYLENVWRKLYCQDQIAYQQHFGRVVSWYDSDLYNQWSLWKNLAAAPDIQYKQAAKEYIYELDHNEYYQRYKTKLHSNGRTTQQGWSAVLEDGSYLAPDDIENLCLLLPEHIQIPE